MPERGHRVRWREWLALMKARLIQGLFDSHTRALSTPNDTRAGRGGRRLDGWDVCRLGACFACTGEGLLWSLVKEIIVYDGATRRTDDAGNAADSVLL